MNSYTRLILCALTSMFILYLCYEFEISNSLNILKLRNYKNVTFKMVPIVVEEDYIYSTKLTTNGLTTLASDNIANIIYDSNFVFLRNEDQKCVLRNNQPPHLVVVVTSSSSNFKSRQAIRETWGSDPKFKDSSTARLIFLVGLSNVSGVNDQVDKESLVNKDIVQCDFMDTYENLSLKSLCMLQWVSQYCSKTKLVLKTDDDVFININNLICKAKNMPQDNIIYGLLFTKSRPVRIEKTKFYVSKSMYPGDEYPSYLSGLGYVMTGDVVDKILNASKRVPFLSMEDVFLTGVCASSVGVKRANVFGFEYHKKHVKKQGLRNMTAIHGVQASEMPAMWKRVKKYSNSC